MTEDVTELNEQYLTTLHQQADLRGRGYEALDAADGPPLDLTALAATCRQYADRFDGRLVLFVASDFGHPAAFVPEGSDAAADKAAVLDGLHQEAGKWQGSHEGLRAVRDAAFETEPNLHKALAALVTDTGVEYDLERGIHADYNFVTIRQVVGLVDWLANSYQADGLTVRY